jgi:hypothetical protein
LKTQMTVDRITVKLEGNKTPTNVGQQ